MLINFDVSQQENLLIFNIQGVPKPSDQTLRFYKEFNSERKISHNMSGKMFP